MKNKDLLQQEEEKRRKQEETEAQQLREWEEAEDYKSIADYYKNKSDTALSDVKSAKETERKRFVEEVLSKAGLNPILSELIDCSSDDTVDKGLEIFQAAGFCVKNNEKKDVFDDLMRIAMEMK